MPPVQQSTLFARIEADNIAYVNNMKREIIHAALIELNDTAERCMIPSAIELENATTETLIACHALRLLQKSPNQP